MTHIVKLLFILSDRVNVLGFSIIVHLTADKQDACWVEYFKETLSQPDPISIFHLEATAPEKLNVNMGLITEKEAEGVIQTQKNNKAPGFDWVKQN